MKKITKKRSGKFPAEVARFFHPEKSISDKCAKKQLQLMAMTNQTINK